MSGFCAILGPNEMGVTCSNKSTMFLQKNFLFYLPCQSQITFSYPLCHETLWKIIVGDSPCLQWPMRAVVAASEGISKIILWTGPPEPGIYKNMKTIRTNDDQEYEKIWLVVLRSGCRASKFDKYRKEQFKQLK